MKSRKRFTVALAAILALLVAGGIALLVRQAFFKPKTITAYFTSATAIYPGDQVRVAGVKVGTIKSIEAQGTKAKMSLAVDRDVPIPANAEAVIVAQNLVGARYVQLTPALRGQRTDDVRRRGDRPRPHRGAGRVGRGQDPADAAGDRSRARPAMCRPPSVGRFIDTAATALDGNGEKLHEAIAQLSGVSRVLADGSGNIVDIIKNLQIFVTALRDSNTQIVQFQDRLATVSSVIDGSRSDLDGALTNLSSAVVDVQRFIAGSRNQTAEQIDRLGHLTQNLADNKLVLENVLHVAPNAIGNSYNIYNPDTRSALGAFALANFANPVQVVCSAIGAVRTPPHRRPASCVSNTWARRCDCSTSTTCRLPFNAVPGQVAEPGEPRSTPNLNWRRAVRVPACRRERSRRPSRHTPGSTATSRHRRVGAYPAPDFHGAYAPNGLPADPPARVVPGRTDSAGCSARRRPARLRRACRTCCFRPKRHRHRRLRNRSKGHRRHDPSWFGASLGGHRVVRCDQCDRLRVRRAELAAAARHRGHGPRGQHLPCRNRQYQYAGIEFAGPGR